MTLSDRMAFCASGILVWLGGTVLFHLYGWFLLDSGGIIYAATVVVAVACLIFIFDIITVKRRISKGQNRSAAITFGAPAMLLEVPILLDFARWMPTIRPESVGAFAAMLLVAYAILFLLASKMDGWRSPAAGVKTDDWKLS